VASGVGKRAVHATVSPPEGEVRTLAQLERAKREAYRLAEDHGVRGGAVVTHGFRIRAEVLAEYREQAEETSEWGAWAYVREEYGENWRQAVYWSPHFHVVGLCRDFAANDPESDEGWVVERLSTLDRFGLTDQDGYESMARVATYILSHATFERESQSAAVTWYGDLAYNKFSPEEAVSSGVLSTIERYAEEACGAGEELIEEDGEESGDPERCEEEGCRGGLQPIWDAGLALSDREFVERIGREREERLRAAFEWAVGDRVPPPGMKRPESEAQAEEALSVIVGAEESPPEERNGVIGR